MSNVQKAPGPLLFFILNGVSTLAYISVFT